MKKLIEKYWGTCEINENYLPKQGLQNLGMTCRMRGIAGTKQTSLSESGFERKT